MLNFKNDIMQAIEKNNYSNIKELVKSNRSYLIINNIIDALIDDNIDYLLEVSANKLYKKVDSFLLYLFKNDVYKKMRKNAKKLKRHLTKLNK